MTSVENRKRGKGEERRKNYTMETIDGEKPHHSSSSETEIERKEETEFKATAEHATAEPSHV